MKPVVRKGQLVWEVDTSIGAGKWRMAKVIELIPSKDGLIRKVKIKNINGVFERAITSLCPLELD